MVNTLLLVVASATAFADERARIIMDEGIVYSTYRDSLGVMTGGIGHNLEGEGYEEGMRIHQRVVHRWFEEDYAEAVDIAKRFAPNAKGEVLDILTNMAFNLGEPRLNTFKKLKEAIANEDWFKAAREMEDSLWYRTVTGRAERLVSRMFNFGYSNYIANWRKGYRCKCRGDCW